MKKVTCIALFTLIIFIAANQSLLAQLNMPQPSPFSKVTQKVGLMEATIEYSRPGAKGRTIFGSLLPYDQMWRTGANSPTKLKFSDKVMINGTEVPAGTYTLMTMPGKDEWTFIISKDSKNRGVFGYNKEEDVLRFKAKSRQLGDMVESFTINFTDIKSNSANIELAWEKTAVKFAFETEVDAKVTAQIKRFLAPDKDAGTYYQIASYYYENNEKIEDALTYITKSVDQRPRYWSMHLKAKIQAKLKSKNEALTSAKKSLEMAKEAGNPDYVRLNEKLISELTQ